MNAVAPGRLSTLISVPYLLMRCLLLKSPIQMTDGLPSVFDDLSHSGALLGVIFRNQFVQFDSEGNWTF